MEQRRVATAPTFQYECRDKTLRVGDVVDGVWRNQFVYDALVLRPGCPEYGYDLLHGGDYHVEVRAGNQRLCLNRRDIFNVRRPYQPGDWAS